VLRDRWERRAFLRAAVVAGIATPGGIGGLISRALAQGEVATTGVHKYRGRVLINDRPAAAGMPVKPGDTVTTGAKSYVTFVVGQDAFLLRGNSKLELGGSGVLVNLARIVTGKLLSVYGKGTPRTLHGTTATIGIRGTGAYMEVSRERNYFCLCYGEAEIVPTADAHAAEIVKTIHHDAPRFIYAAGKARIIERAPVINHKDEELILLESLVGRVPPFVDTDQYRSGVRY
jgi:hypothetical protein